MARWACIFDDKPEMLAIRGERRPQHLAYLEAHFGRILISGGLSPDIGLPPEGGLWIVEAETRAEAVSLIENDPYFVPEFRSYRLFVWGKALKNRTAEL